LKLLAQSLKHTLARNALSASFIAILLDKVVGEKLVRGPWELRRLGKRVVLVLTRSPATQCVILITQS